MTPRWRQNLEILIVLAIALFLFYLVYRFFPMQPPSMKGF